MSGTTASYGDTEAPSDSGFWGDLGRNLWSGTLSTAGSLASAAEYATGHEGFGTVASELGKEANYQVGQMSPGGRRAVQAEFLPGGDGPSAYDDGFGGFIGAVAAQAVNSLPSMAAAVIPGSLVARGISTAAGMAMVGGVTGTLTTGTIFGAIADHVGQFPDAELRQASEPYDVMREQGMDEAEAKRALIRQAAGLKPLIGGVLSAAVGALTEGRAVANIATRGRGMGAVAGARQGAQAEAREEFVQSGVEDLGGQLGQRDATGREVDPMQTVRAGVQGAVVGGAMGGAMGGAGGALITPAGRQRRPAIDPEATVIDPDQRAAAAALNPDAPPSMADIAGPVPTPFQAPPRTMADLYAAPEQTDPLAAMRGEVPAAPGAPTNRPSAIALSLPADPLAGMRGAPPPTSGHQLQSAISQATGRAPGAQGALGADEIAAILARHFTGTPTPTTATPAEDPATQPLTQAPPVADTSLAAATPPRVPTTAPAGPPAAAPAPPAAAAASAPQAAAPVQSAPVAGGTAPAAAPTLAEAVAQLPESDRALVQAAPPKIVEAFWKAAKGDSTGLLDRLRRRASTASAAESLKTAAPQAPPADPPVAPPAAPKVREPGQARLNGFAEADGSASVKPVEKPVAPAAPTKRTPMQDGAAAQVEQRLVGIARAAGARQQFTDDAITAIMADLEEELRASKGGASEIAKRILDKHDMKAKFIEAVAKVEHAATQDEATPEVAEKKAKPPVDERLKKPAIDDAVKGGAGALEKMARVLGRVDKENFITGAVRLHDAMEAAGQEPWPPLKEAKALQASAKRGGSIAQRKERAGAWEKIQKDVAAYADTAAAPAREKQTAQETAADRAFDAYAPKGKADLTPAGLKQRVVRMLADVRADNGGKLNLPKRDANKPAEENDATEAKVSPKALWIRAVMTAIADSSSPAQIAELAADEALIRAGDAKLFRERRRVDGDIAKRQGSADGIGQVQASDAGREEGYQDFGGEDDRGRKGVKDDHQFSAHGTVRVHDDGRVEVRVGGDVTKIPSGAVQPARRMLQRVNPRNLGERMLVSKLRSLIGDVQVVTLDGATMDDLMGQDGFLGAFMPPSKAAAKQGSNGIILIREDAAMDETLLHELTHAATAAKLESDPQLAARAEALAQAMKQTLDGDALLGKKERDQFAYYLQDAHELVAGVFSDPKFQAWMNTHTLDAASFKAVTGSEPSGQRTTFWQVVVDLIRSALHLPKAAATAFEAAMALGHEALIDQEESARIFARRSPGGADSLGRVGSTPFKAWFGDSKVVDDKGEPLRLFHGTAANIQAFDPAKLGSATNAPSAEVGFFFTDRPKTADYYSTSGSGSMAAATEAAGKRLTDAKRDARIYAGTSSEAATKQRAESLAGPNVVPVYLSLQNPLVHDFKGKMVRDESYRALIDRARAEGYDGVILKNTYDAGERGRFDALMQGRIRPETVYVAFRPEQIKSAVSNTGDYSPTDPRIHARRITEMPAQLLESARPGLKGLGDKGRAGALALQTARQIEEVFRSLFAWTDATKAKAKSDNPLTQVVQGTLQRATTAREHRKRADGIIQAANALEKADPAMFKALSDLALDATVAGVHPDVGLTDPKNKHVSATRIGDRTKRNAHPQLAARWAKLSPEAKALYRDMSRVFESYHADVSRMLITNIVETVHFQQAERDRKAGKPVAAPPDFAAMAERFIARKETDADEKAVGEHGAAQIKAARKLARVKGPYFPQRRFGDFVVEWEEAVQAVHEFATQAAAEAFLDQQTLPTEVQVETYDAAGERIRSKKNPDPTKPNPVVAKTIYRVTVQNKGLEFFDTRGEADAFHAEMKAKGVKALSAVDLREKSDARRADLLPGQLRDLLAGIKRDPNIPDERRATTAHAIEDAALRLLPGSSVKASWLRRRNVAGASRDLQRVSANYANAASNFLAKLEHAPQIDDGIAAMAGHIRETSRSDTDDKTVARRQVLREMQARADLAALDSQGGGSGNPWIRRMQSFAFVYYLASPAYTAINLMQPWMTGLPWLGARHGAGKAAAAMRRAMDDVGGLGVLKAGLRESAQAFQEALGKADKPRLDYLSVVKQHLTDSKVKDAAEVGAMLDRLATEGLIDLTAGLELGRAMEGNPSWIGSKAQQVEDMARALPAAAEVLNRATMAVAAFRLVTAEGGTPEAAFKAAEEAVSATQFDYTAANTARVMDARRHPLLAPMMTFRKFAQGTYFLLARQTYLAVKGGTKEERRIAGRTLAGVLATHLVMAGALGLPLEPIKLALGLVAFLFGADEPWDYETAVRNALTDTFGKEVAEVIANGLPRALGVDLSSRVGLDSLIFLKELRDFKPETLGQYMGEFLIGAPGAALTNASKAPGLLWDGDFAGAASAVLPKGIRDVIKAATLADSGVVTKKGERIDNNVPLGVDEAIMQALGLQPARVQEVYEGRNAIKGAERRLNASRTGLLQDYRQAKPDQRGAVWDRIREWNQGQPREARITFDNARAALRESSRRERESNGGTYVPRNRRFLLEEGRFANTRAGER